jgi:hypothetical protein
MSMNNWYFNWPSYRVYLPISTSFIQHSFVWLRVLTWSDLINPHDEYRSSGPRPGTWCISLVLYSAELCLTSHIDMVRLTQSSRWAPVLRSKTSKTLFGPVNLSVFFKNYTKINSRIWFGPVNSNFHFEDWHLTLVVTFCECDYLY